MTKAFVTSIRALALCIACVGVRGEVPVTVSPGESSGSLPSDDEQCPLPAPPAKSDELKEDAGSSAPVEAPSSGLSGCTDEPDHAHVAAAEEPCTGQSSPRASSVAEHALEASEWSRAEMHMDVRALPARPGSRDLNLHAACTASEACITCIPILTCAFRAAESMPRLPAARTAGQQMHHMRHRACVRAGHPVCREERAVPAAAQV